MIKFGYIEMVTNYDLCEFTCIPIDDNEYSNKSIYETEPEVRESSVGIKCQP